MNKDWTGGNNSVFTTIGAKGHSDEERETNDFYATSPKAIDKLASVFTLPKNIYECACGQGHLSERLKELGCNVYSSDLIDRGYGETDVDFLQAKLPKMFEGTPVSILTNPPYKISTDFIVHALDLVPEGSYVIFFLKTTALEGKSRYERIYKNYPPRYVFQFIERMLCAKNADFTGMSKAGSAVSYAWFVWQKGYKGDTVIKWI